MASCFWRSRLAWFELMTETKMNNAKMQPTIVTNAVLSIKPSTLGGITRQHYCRVKNKLGGAGELHDGECSFRSHAPAQRDDQRLPGTVFVDKSRTTPAIPAPLSSAR